jgi:acetoin:2,6-dichlorophenolindophenol oxidoreductase subunit alpha
MSGTTSLSHSATPSSTDARLSMYRTMVTIRRFEEEALLHYQNGNIPGALHVCIGQEACSTGACSALAHGDLVLGTHRSHGDVIARGGEPSRMMAELFGRVDGYCKGKGGSMHMMDIKRGILGANGIVGAGLPIAIGAALSSKLRGTSQVVLVFFGDGAVGEGDFHESLNLAAVWNLPVVFFCQNNQYAVSMNVHDAQRADSLAAYAGSYKIPGKELDGNDVMVVHEETLAAADHARQGRGPVLLVGTTYRIMGHMVGDPGVYRSKEEIDSWKRRDPIVRFGNYLRDARVATEQGLDRIQSEVDGVIKEAVSFALASPLPNPEDAMTDVFGESPSTAEARLPPPKRT